MQEIKNGRYRSPAVWDRQVERILQPSPVLTGRMRPVRILELLRCDVRNRQFHASAHGRADGGALQVYTFCACRFCFDDRRNECLGIFNKLFFAEGRLADTGMDNTILFSAELPGQHPWSRCRVSGSASGRAGREPYRDDRQQPSCPGLQ